MDFLVPATIVVVMFVACLFQASVGFGANVIAQPIVYLLDPSLVPGSIILAAMALNVMVLTRERQRPQRGPLGWGVLGMVGGATVGAFTIRTVSDDGLAIVIAVTVLAMVGILSTNLDIPRSPRTIGIAGLLGGFAGVTSGIGGPPMALLFNREKGATIRGFLSGYFLLSTAVALTALSLAGRFGWEEALNGLRLFPVAAVAFLLSRPLLPVVDRGNARPMILGVSAAAALVLLGRTLIG